MPTGYTAAIKDGISFEQYVWSCARAFGALVMMRDEPTDATIPQEFAPSDYYSKSVDQSKEKLSQLRAMTPEQASAEALNAHGAALTSWNKRKTERTGLRNKYNAMLEKVRSWTPPTADHVGMKEFMEKQIVESIDRDCSDKYDATPPPVMSAAAWLASEIAEAERMLRYAEKSLAEEIECTNSRNAWLKALRESVPQPAA
jgi:hypothetical protein